MQVLIGGIAGATGRLLAETLRVAPGITHLIGIDQVPLRPAIAGVQFVRVYPRQFEWRALLTGTDAVIHLPGVAAPRRAAEEQYLFADTRFFVEAALAAGVRKIIVATSAAVYGPQASAVVTEVTPVRGAEAGLYARVRAQVSDYLDAVAQLSYNNGLVNNRTRGGALLTRLRMAPLVGARHLALAQVVRANPALISGRKAANGFSIVHEADAIQALQLALNEDLPGVYNVSDPDPLTVADWAEWVDQDRGYFAPWWLLMRRWVGRPVINAWARLLSPGYTLSAAKFQACGWQPAHSARAAVQAAALVALDKLS